ncbi:hypothetical protein H0H87_004895 [Tephrocybe sp. NHM501043]|nr:hypothetical protein H0H87_004895 [Tephrocybe sp. NHM501043]
MLKHALLLQKYFKDFLSEIRRKEPNYKKHIKIDALLLNNDEWERVKKFVKVLDLPDRAQQAFSAENTPTLHNGVPTLEALHAAWSALKDRAQYSEFWDALTAGIEKIKTYYKKAADSHAYTFAMLLDPNTKMTHFKKHWSAKLQDEIHKSAENIVCPNISRSSTL